MRTDAVSRIMESHGIDVDKWEAAQAAVTCDPQYIPLARRRIMPPPWRVVQLEDRGGAYSNGTVNVIVSVAKEQDGRHWLHVSASGPRRIPTWNELKAVKALFVGKDRVALQILPAERDYVNICPFVLHLWACLDGDVTPDFTRGTGSL